MSSYCAIDFGTSNSAIALPDDTGGVALVELGATRMTVGADIASAAATLTLRLSILPVPGIRKN